MAITYSLHTASDLSVGAACSLLARVPGFARVEDGVTAPDLFVSIWDPGELASEIIQEAFGFDPGLEIYFRLHNLGDGPGAVDSILRATASLLRETEADLSLLLNGESPVLTRLGGRLLFYAIPQFWTDARLKLMPEPSSFTDPVIL